MQSVMNEKVDGPVLVQPNQNTHGNAQRWEGEGGAAAQCRE